MEEGDPAHVLAEQDERLRRHGALEVEATGHTLHEHSLAGAQLAGEEDHVAGLCGPAQRLA